MDIDDAATSQRPECCSQCPFARSASKEYLDTRGENSERFIGQVHINALLPCHMDSTDQNATVGEGRQCAGAAKFRANIGVNLRPEIGKLPPDREAVFSTEAELLAHHVGISVELAEQYIAVEISVDEMATNEFNLAIAKGRYAT